MGGMGRRILSSVTAGVLVAGASVALALPGAVVARSARAASGEPAPSLFGLNTGTYDRSHRRFAKDLPTARKLGATWVAFTGGSLHWKPSGEPVWSTMDYEVNKARSLGLGVLISLGGVPSACAYKTPAPNNCPPTDIAAYRKSLKTELLRYGDRVTYWESWVEENHKASWQPGGNGGPDPAAYAKLLTAQYAVFQQVNQEKGWNLKLLFGSPMDFSIIPGSPGGTAVLPYTHAVLQALGGAKAFDGIALHAYRFPPATTAPSVADWDSVEGIPAAPGGSGPYPNQGCTTSGAKWCQMTWSQELSAYEQEFAYSGYPNEPLWVTQFGWPGNDKAGDKYHPDYATQKQDLEAAYQVLKSLPFVQAAFWFNQRDYNPKTPNPEPEFFRHYGLLTYKFGLKPAGCSFATLAGGDTGAFC